MLEINKVHQGDCLELMKEIESGSVDMIFTDPPYKLTAGGRKDTMLHGSISCNVNPFTTTGEVFASKTPEFSSWIPEVYRVAKESAYVFIMCNDRNLQEIWKTCESVGFNFCELLVMKKQNKVPSSYFYKNCEFILMFRKGSYKKLYKFGHSTVIDVNLPRGNQKVHPTEKPIELLLPIIESCSQEGDLIFDPFAGSGSTLIAAKNTKRNFIGFELEQKYYEAAQERLLKCALS